MPPAQAPSPRTFLTIAEMRALLPAKFASKTDDEIAAIRAQAYEFAHLIVDMHRRMRVDAMVADGSWAR